MTGKTHAMVGAACATTMACIPSMSMPLVSAMFCGALGGVLPDVDIKQSKAGKYAKRVAVWACISVLAFVAFMQRGIAPANLLSGHSLRVCARVLVSIGMLVCLWLAGIQCGHRSVTHSLFALVWVMLASALLGTEIALCVCIGYASHLAIDLLNKKGEQLLFPLEKRYCIGVCSANGKVDQILRLIGGILIVLVCVFIAIR